MIYFTADLHLGHHNVSALAGRPFTSTEEMDEVLIDNWNKKVKGCDTVFILGDLIVGDTDPERYLGRLKGKKILLLGNHDHGWIESVDKNKYFNKIELMIEQSLFGKMFTLCHYPLTEWRNSRKEFDCKKLGFLIHGHIHGRFKELYVPLFTSPNALNAGVDINGYQPVTFEELYKNNSRFKHEKLLGDKNEEILTENEIKLGLKF